MPIIPLNDVGKGLNKDLLASELELGMWSDSLNFRFRNNFAETVQGIAQKFSSLTGVYSAAWFYTAVSGTGVVRWLIVTNGVNVFAHNGTTGYDISPSVPAVSISTAVWGGGIVTVTTATAHSLTTADLISVSGFTPSGYNIASVAVTVTGANTFTYPMAVGPGVATVIGQYYVITSVNAPILGSGGYRITGDVLNGTFIMGTFLDGGPWYWNGDSSQKMRPFLVPSFRSISLRTFKDYIVQVGTNDGTTYWANRVNWSTSAEPGAIPTSFTSTSTNDAGLVDLAAYPGKMLDTLPLNDVNIIYSEDSRYAMQYVGGNDVFRFTRLPGDDGIFGTGCVVDTPKGHVFMTKDLDVKIHQGGVATSIAGGLFKDFIRAILYVPGQLKAFLAINPSCQEVWICFSTAVSEECQYAIMWNWESGKFGIRYIPDGILCGATGILPSSQNSLAEQRLVVCSAFVGATSNGMVGLTESGSTDFGGAITASLERTGMHFDQRNVAKTAQRLRLNADATAGDTAQVYLGSAMTADATPTYTSPVTYTVGTSDFVNARAIAGKYIAMKIVKTVGAAPFKVRSEDMDVAGGGSR